MHEPIVANNIAAALRQGKGTFDVKNLAEATVRSLSEGGYLEDGKLTSKGIAYFAGLTKKYYGLFRGVTLPKEVEAAKNPPKQKTAASEPASPAEKVEKPESKKPAAAK